MAIYPDGDEIGRVKYTHPTNRYRFQWQAGSRNIPYGDVASYPDGDEIGRVKYTHPTNRYRFQWQAGSCNIPYGDIAPYPRWGRDR